MRCCQAKTWVLGGRKGSRLGSSWYGDQPRKSVWSVRKSEQHRARTGGAGRCGHVPCQCVRALGVGPTARAGTAAMGLTGHHTAGLRLRKRTETSEGDRQGQSNPTPVNLVQHVTHVPHQELHLPSLTEHQASRLHTRPLTLQLLEQEGLPTPPLGVEPHADGRLHGGLAEDVRQGAAVQVIAQHVPVCLRRRQVSWEQRETSVLIHCLLN